MASIIIYEASVGKFATPQAIFGSSENWQLLPLPRVQMRIYTYLSSFSEPRAFMIEGSSRVTQDL
jgi:hypothetical protein